MRLRLRRRRDRSEARRERLIERAQREETANEVVESDRARADLDNAGLRGFGRSGPAGFLGGGSRLRRNARQSLREEGYDGD